MLLYSRYKNFLPLRGNGCPGPSDFAEVSPHRRMNLVLLSGSSCWCCGGRVRALKESGAKSLSVKHGAVIATPTASGAEGLGRVSAVVSCR